MLSEQVERLGEIADFLESDPRTQATAPEVRQAADTICELRSKLAGVVDQSEEIDRLKAESAKLRKLLCELYACSRQYGCDRCGYKDGCAMLDRMAQLGVEE